jgi:hypothetical protein
MQIAKHYTLADRALSETQIQARPRAPRTPAPPARPAPRA